MAPILFLSIFIIATCGLIYELVSAAVASYVLGDSITQFSLIIGLYLSAMGLGSWLSRYVERQLLLRFIQVELAVGMVGGLSSTALFLAFDQTAGFHLLLFMLVGVTGTLVGLEIPLLIRLLQGETTLKDAVSRVLSLDYVGALFASLLFPTLLLPRLGLVRTSLLFGMLNVGVGGISTLVFRNSGEGVRRLRAISVGCLLMLAAVFVGAEDLVSFAEARLYADEVILKVNSPYQKLVVTRWREDIRLYINANLQFSSVDEYRYHEALVHPAMALLKQRKRVLVLGGGDGMAVREVLRYPDVEQVVLVDLDPAMTHLFSTAPLVTELNHGALTDRRVQVINEDAFLWIQKPGESFDLVVADFPDPNNHSLGKLYTRTFYHFLAKRLSQTGIVVVQSSSPYFTPNTFWCVVNTLADSGFSTLPYHTYVPSFGEWGYVLGAHLPLSAPAHLGIGGLRYLDDQTLPQLFQFPKDMGPRTTPINRLDNQDLVRIYEEEWRHFL